MATWPTHKRKTRERKRMKFRDKRRAKLEARGTKKCLPST